MSHNPASDTVTAQQSPPPFDWATFYQGVDLAYQSWPCALDPAAEEKSRLQNVNVARINLLQAGISFYTTPASDPSCANQTIGRTCTEFLQENSAVMLAINANLSWYDGQDVSGAYFALFGLAISNGDVVCDPSLPAWRPGTPTELPDVPDETYVGAVALLITPDNHASIQTVTAAQPIDTSPYQTAIAGSTPPGGGGFPPMLATPGPRQVLVNGQNMGVPQASPAEKVAGRTAVGLSQDGNTLYLLTIDGIETQPYGADFYDLGAWLQLAGAYNGFNLDGGGSTTMARRDPSTGEPILVNQPHGNETSAVVERAVGNFFGVIAPWLQ